MIHFYPMSRYIIYIFIVKCSSVIGLKQYKTSKYLSSDNSRHHRETSRDSNIIYYKYYYIGEIM